MTKIKLTFANATELDEFVTEYVHNSLRGAEDEVESPEQFAVRSFEEATRWSESKRDHVSIQDMNTKHILNALAQEIVAGRNRKDELMSWELSALLYHAWLRMLEEIRENQLCED